MTADAVGGVWTYALTLAKALRPHGVQIALATMGDRPSEDQRREAAALENVELFESAFRLEWMEDPWDDVRRAGDWLLDLEQRVAPDIVHLNGYVHGALDWRHPAIVVGHSCVLSWWRAVKGEGAPAGWNRYRDAVRRGLAAADAVVAPSHAMLGELQRYYGPLPPAVVIPNGADPLAYCAAPKEPFIFAAGRLWDEAKNIAALERIADELDWPVYLAGERQAAPPAPPCTRTLGSLSRKAMRDWLGRASIYALPARYEPFGLSILEAALSGCALVLGDIPSLRENWDAAAAFVPPEDPDALRRTVQILIADDEARMEMAAGALRRGLDFTPDKLAELYLNLYRTCAQNSFITR